MLEGDLVVLTGDYVHLTPRSIESGISVLARLRARYGAVAVLGNHEHWEGAESCRVVFRRIGIPLIDNARLFLTPEGLVPEARPGQCLCIGGVGDLWEDAVRFDLAIDGAPDSTPRIVLSHNPDTAEMVRQSHRVDLMLSGHTHGGQVSFPYVGPPVNVSAYGRKYLQGLCHGPHCPVIVSCGVGLAGVPARFGTRPDITEVRLRRT